MATTAEHFERVSAHEDGCRPGQENKFCPDGGLLSGAGMETQATSMVLQMLLRPLGVLMAVGSAAYILREFVIDARAVHWTSYLLTGVIIVLTVLLFTARDLSLPRLRVIELALFVAVSAQIVLVDYERVITAAASGDAGLVLSELNMTLLEFMVVMAAYAIFIPNTARRAALLVIPLALATPAIWFAVTWRHPEVAAVVAPVLGFRAQTDLLFITAITVAVCLLGVALITRYRSTALEARAANLYDLQEKIGEGGMGEVWLARHQTLARPAAIKIVRPDLAAGGDVAKGEIAVKRFAREAQATAALTSPHTVEIYDFGVTEEQVFYYVMEYLEGMDLGTLVKRHGPLPAARAVYLLRQACASLQDAHNRSLIHRDIKPANLFTCRLGTDYDFVKVLDFGLVKDQSPDDQTQLTVDGLTTGTPAFMAPEMALQDGRVGPATDIYALGCVAYWLLTGKLVFDEPTPVAMIVGHVKTEPEPPSSRTELPIPAKLDEIILRCLRKDPAERFGSMRELSAALAQVPTDDRWDEDRAEEWWELHQPAQPDQGLARAS